LPSRPRPLLYAHRGASAELPENTLPAFRRALEVGANALETDVHMTRDGHIVVSHDPDGRRMCGVAAEIRRSSLAEVRSWNAGRGFVGPGQRSRDYQIPTLEELLSEFPTVPINIDIKQKTPPMAAHVVALLRRLNAETRVTVASFDARNVRAVRRLGYRGPTSLARAEVLQLLATPAAFGRMIPRTGNAAQIPVRIGPVRTDTRQFIGKCHRLGLRVDYWTINSPDEAQRLLEAGADGIMSDNPAVIAPVFAAWRS
jgi:glycerophosphoryl diester phosphodiesterase